MVSVASPHRMMGGGSNLSIAAVLARPSFRESTFASVGATVVLIGRHIDVEPLRRWWQNALRLVVGSSVSSLLVQCCGPSLGAAMVLAQPTRRELVSTAVGATIVWLGHRIADLLSYRYSWHTMGTLEHTDLRKEFLISNIVDLRRAIPAGMSGSNVSDAIKVIHYLDAQMQEFIARAPLVQLATADASGLPFVSPKGDKPGFVEVICKAGRGVALRIPDRPGNQLLFGMQNILEGSRSVGILFVIPGNETTLRCGGRASLTRDPDLLKQHSARGRQATMIIHIEIEYAFFHCSKAYIRSELWKPETWPSKEDKLKVSFGPYFFRDQKKQAWLDGRVEEKYQEVRDAVAGRDVE
eukprot:TRINITY_DN29396_c0_g1_i1.p1 TRINITY_DN29396_c0_g1~~TRINITY_DN29396_c0_g1_i1.p1  ORF type:complete len:354 (+),score=42.73 TRINITY_DN29396_c0_g1_i1:33-1094(+)